MRRVYLGGVQRLDQAGERGELAQAPVGHRAKISGTSPLERVNGEIKRRSGVVGIYPNEAAIRRLIGALLLEQHDEWATQRRYMPLETMAPIGDAATVRLPSTPA